MITVRDLVVDLAGLKGVDLDVEPGQIVGVTGVNSAGKSTLLRCLTGLQDFDAGRVEVLGRAPSAVPGSGARPPTRRRNRPGIPV